MSGIEMAYLFLVVVAMISFAGVLAWVTHGRNDGAGHDKHA
jgi:hypothetical protein